MSTFTPDASAFGAAIRALLEQPLLLRTDEPERFRAVAVQRAELATWFEDNLGWRLRVDLPAGVARLHKRAAVPDPHRGVRRAHGTGRAFDVLRYQLLALTCAQLLRRPHLTVGDLADAIARVTGGDEALLTFDPTKHMHRLAFVDVLLWLSSMGAIASMAGDLEGYATAEQTDAVLRANTTVIPLLLSSDTPPSTIAATTAEDWLVALTREPRYGVAADDPGLAERDQRNQWARHQLARRLLDDPAVALDALPPAIREYLQTPAGRDKALRVVKQAGLECERHADVWLAVDPSGESSSTTFASSSRPSVTQQVALILLRALVPTDAEGQRRPLSRSIHALEAELDSAMKRNPTWAQGARKAGVAATCAEALDLLEQFGLVHQVGGEVRTRPAAARFTIAQGDAP
jgi:uncharacterized protein (TIGR02678 family)